MYEESNIWNDTYTVILSEHAVNKSIITHPLIWYVKNVFATLDNISSYII